MYTDGYLMGLQVGNTALIPVDTKTLEQQLNETNEIIHLIFFNL